MKGGTTRDRALLFRAGAGGALMGLANLVPGVSGGTMLLAAGVYPALIRALAELTRLRLSWRPVLLAGTVAASGALAIGLFAGWIRELVIGQRWVMYSLFIGLTLGGVPLIWRLSRPTSPSFWIGAAFGFALLLPTALGPPTGSAGEGGAILLVLAGVAGAAAMILPGISGAYLLLLLGQYEVVLGAVERLKQVLLSGGADTALLSETLSVLVPVAAGAVLGAARGDPRHRLAAGTARQADSWSAAGPSAGSRPGAVAIPGGSSSAGRGDRGGPRADAGRGRESRAGAVAGPPLRAESGPLGRGARPGRDRIAGDDSPGPAGQRPGIQALTGLVGAERFELSTS